MDHRLSPVLNGFQKAGDHQELTIIYCGTGLSIRTLHWVLSSSKGVKEAQLETFPYELFTLPYNLPWAKAIHFLIHRDGILIILCFFLLLPWFNFIKLISFLFAHWFRFWYWCISLLMRFRESSIQEQAPLWEIPCNRRQSCNFNPGLWTGKRYISRLQIDKNRPFDEDQA